MINEKEYLGDGAYVDFDGYQIWLTTSNGIRTTNEVALEPLVLERFLQYIERLKHYIEDLKKDMELIKVGTNLCEKEEG
jgi:hypothetical protein